MKAIVYEKYGPPADVLQYKDVETPVPNEDEILVKIHAASLNFGDPVLVRGKPLVARLWSGASKPKHQILGTDIAGVVEAVGINAKRFAPNDEVFADISVCGFGAFAEYVPVPENVLAPKPSNLSFEEAAAVPQAAVVALQGLRDEGNIALEQKVLVNGASGGVGTFAVQIAKSFGAEVTGVCSTKNVDLVRSIGADRVIDYTKEDFTQSCEVYDLILDIVANRSVSEYTRVLGPTGTYVACAFNPTSLFLGPMISKKGGKQVKSLTHKPKLEDLIFMRGLLESGRVVPVIDRRYPLSEVPEAMKYLEDGHHHGKVVITISHNGK